MRIYLALFIHLFPVALLAQEGLQKEEAFFNAQIEAYQGWLDRSGMGDLLEVHTITVEPELVNLYLKVPNSYDDRDSVADYTLKAWRELRREFRKQNTNGLEVQLFLKMLYYFELEPTQCSVQLYDTYELYDSKGYIHPYVSYMVHYEDKKVTMDSSIANRASYHEIPVVLPDVQQYSHCSSAGTPNGVSTTQALFQAIYKFAKQRFQASDARISPLFTDLEKGIFVLSVKPLYQEVLKSESSYLPDEWLRRLGLLNDATKSEWLTLRFDAFPLDYGYRLYCTLDGKFSEKTDLMGERGAYQPIDPDHDPVARQVLQEYGDELMGELWVYLGN